ncbi:inositol monophosphatase family protein [Actinokineospora enzanensis]|uniref:inositol monophosphatase family protein n=1 Tax=Actinokineospora enzanensis TaxID=155975 RepID=UPI000372FFD4|nr:inositol monophosphatase family protein [Actinokineospora enzanensis]
MLTSVIEIVQDVAATVPTRTSGPATLDELYAEFVALDGPLTDELRTRLVALGPAWARGAGDGWVVDAMDGAVQYLQGLPQWCVSVTLVREGLPVLTVLHSPFVGETYAAEAGSGAWRNGQPVRPSAKTSLDAALATTSHPHTRQPDANRVAGHALPYVLDAVAAVRNLGPTSWQIADVAAGRVDLFWQFGLDRENLLGASLIAREAGAVITTATGRPWTPDAPSFLAAAPGLHAAAVTRFCNASIARQGDLAPIR